VVSAPMIQIIDILNIEIVFLCMISAHVIQIHHLSGLQHP
jgi:hypothetical protein